MPSNSRVTLQSGREIEIQELNQELTYAGFIEGFPTTDQNKRKIDGILKACMASAGATPVLLFEPEEKLIEHNQPYPFGTPATIPHVTCIAKLQSTSLRERDPLMYSELIVIWLQDEFALPIEPSTLQWIVELDWENVAREFEV